MSDGDHEIRHGYFVLLYFHAQVILSALHQGKVSARGVPVALTADGLQGSLRRLEGLRAAAVPAVLVFAEVGSIYGLGLTRRQDGSRGE